MEDARHSFDQASSLHDQAIDTSVDSTKALIAKAYFDLVKSGESKNISVKDVVERAGVSRMTFYYHFKDIYDLVDWSLRTNIEKTLQHAHTAHDIWHTFSNDIVEILENDQYGYMECFQYLDPNILRRNFSNLFFDLSYAGLQRDQRLSIYSAHDKKFLAKLMSYCLIGILEDLLDHATNVDVEDYIDRFDRLVVGNMFPFSKHFPDDRSSTSYGTDKRYRW